ncbi:MAG: hypothetical protein WCE79_00050 [Xanthobacteraceae bacterium]
MRHRAGTIALTGGSLFLAAVLGVSMSGPALAQPLGICVQNSANQVTRTVAALAVGCDTEDAIRVSRDASRNAVVDMIRPVCVNRLPAGSAAAVCASVGRLARPDASTNGGIPAGESTRRLGTNGLCVIMQNRAVTVTELNEACFWGGVKKRVAASVRGRCGYICQ